MRVTQISGIELRIARAELAVEQAIDEYLAVVARAEMLADQLAWLEQQRSDVRQLVGSPAVVFGRANRILTAEASIDMARERLMDWLVALEYEAVRPFMEQRIALMLARSPGQLEDVAAQLRLIRTRCGGPVSRQSAAVSLRFDLLGYVEPAEDPLTGELVAPAGRFREWLAGSTVPFNRRARFFADSTVGEALANRAAVLAGSIPVDLDDFANLGASCNARIESLGIELVGDVGFARPSVSVLHDGTARIRSCQPDLDALLRASGASASSYAQVSHLRAPGRPASMVASLNQPPPADQRNASLAGLPLSSTYTVVIMPTIGENPSLDWDRLEDIILHFTYTYQDPFVEGQCR